MAIEKAPYVNYTEINSYVENIANGSEIPLFIVKTNNTVNVSDITAKNVLRFISYGQFKKYFKISEDESVYNALPDTIKELDVLIKEFFVENSMYGDDNSYGLTVPYIYLIDVGNEPTLNHYIKALSVSEAKRNSTVVVIPNTEDIGFMKEVNLKLKEETKNGLLRISYFGVSGQGKVTEKFAVGDVVKPTFDHHGYVNVVEGNYNSSDEEFVDSSNNPIGKSNNIVYHDVDDDKYYICPNATSFEETTLNALTGYTEVVEGYKNGDNFYEESSFTTEITPKESALYLNKSSNGNADAYTYNGAFVSIEVNYTEDVLLHATDGDYKFFVPSTKNEMGGANESFDEYCERCAYISNEVQSSRVAIVERELFGKTIARICSTPYYIEPGYLPYMSVNLGIFKELSSDERDALFGTGLIFNEDDYTLTNITPRMCLATSTAWGIENHDLRTTDALIHARRNVDHHIRRILNIIAPQLKRNETSVTLRHVKNQIDNYLNDELSNGTIMEYVFDIKESSYNPYTLLISGKITPVNSTLAIEFENTVGSPYAIASDYV